MCPVLHEMAPQWQSVGYRRGEDMSSNEHNYIRDFMGALVQVATVYVDGQHSQAVDKATDNITDTEMDKAVDFLQVDGILPLIDKLAKTPVWDAVKVMIQDAVAQRLEEESFSPCGAAKPARQLLQALETIRVAGKELQRWADDSRYNLPKSNNAKVTAPPRFNLFHRTPAPQRAILPVAEIIEQLHYLMSLLNIAEKEAQRALEAMAHVRDPRLRISPDHMRPLPDDIASGGFFPLPTSWSKAQGTNGRDLLTWLQQFGKYLVQVAERGLQRIREASVDDKAFSPAVVGAQASTISSIVRSALSTCSALEFVSTQYIGESVTIE